MAWQSLELVAQIIFSEPKLNQCIFLGSSQPECRSTEKSDQIRSGKYREVTLLIMLDVSTMIRRPSNTNPSVVLIPGLGMIAWGKNKSESRVTAEFYNCALGVMRGAEAVDDVL